MMSAIADSDVMQAALYRRDYCRILYDADHLPRPAPACFQPEYWRDRARVEPLSQGRGGGWLIRTGDAALVLKHYLRGGLAARFSRERYVFSGWERSRGLREWRMLAAMRERRLPVPRPLAALCLRQGRFCRAALLTIYVDHTRSLIDVLQGAEQEDIGQLAHQTHALLTRFHAAGIYHPDLNLGNILVDAGRKLWLVDFDRAGFGRLSARRLRRMRRRLLRSLSRLTEAGKVGVPQSECFRAAFLAAGQACRNNKELW